MSFWNDLSTWGDRVALISAEGCSLTYAELAGAADIGVAGHEGRHLILIMMANRPDAIVAYMGALRAGWGAILINDGDGGLQERITATYRPSLTWSPDQGLSATGHLPVDLHPDLAVMLSTSGTTGSAKLVRLSAGAIDANARSIADYLDLNVDERAITTLAPAYSYGLSVINSHLAVGGAIILNDASVIDPEFHALATAQGATSFAGVPHSYELAHRSGLLANLPPTIRTMTQAGGRLAPHRVKEIAARATAEGRRFFVMYGQTEATARMAYLPPDRAETDADCIGRAIPGGSFSIVDGELVYAGPNVMMGYAENADDLAKGPGVERLMTGDLAEEKGELYRLTGRKSRFIKPYGLRVSLDEVEAQAAAMGHILVATGDDEQLVLASEVAGDAVVLPVLSQRYGLPEAAIAFQLYPVLPRLSSGKPDYRAILADANANAATTSKRSGTDHDDEGSDPIATIRRFYQSLKPRVPITEDSSFASLGGDSLSYVQATIVLEEALGHLPPGWEHMPLSAMAGSVQEAKRGGKLFQFRSVEGEMLARTFAITLIVMSHVWYPAKWFGIGTGGGAAVLIAIFGFNLFRFRSQTLLGPKPLSIVPTLSIRYILPYYAVILFFSIREGFHWQNFALVGVFFNGPSGALHLYWFFEALFHLCILIGLIFSVPAVSRKLISTPDRTVLALTVAAVALRIGVEYVRPGLGIAPRTPDAFLYLALGGLGMAAATRVSTRYVIAAIMVAVQMYMWGFAASPWIVLAAGLAILILFPRVPLPTPLAVVVQQIARSTIYIYLCSGFVIRIFQVALNNELLWGHFFATFLVGIAAERAINVARVWWGKRSLTARHA